jgi:hypothetical protein
MSFEATKDPSSVEDFSIDWTATLADSSPADTISSSTWTADNGVTVTSDAETTTTTTVWVSGGTLGRYCNLVNRIVTTGGRTYDRTITLKIQQT